MATAIDTLATYEAIAAAGIGDSGARAISKAIADAAATYREDLATKSDLGKVEAELKGDIAEVKSSIKVDISVLREHIATNQNKTLIWMFGMLVTFSGVIVGFIKLT
ncbi:hypothetical protein [Polymorphobacter megasporae]|uniref:hypothetical protein n=1 Tax=Glacieibacterium megasporae TaxID=2835787 RepID=UPI001C1E421A|nr:hypothetical protein [Polymorphobacter megasporae]UAJ10238.1 hypothetical protein KTC28_00210 [Polymorphobacter megasporae]